MLEAIKTVGSFAGLVSAAFLVWDRLVRGRPLAWVAATKFGAASYEYVRVVNPGPGGVFIRRVDVHPPIYGLAKDHSARAIAGTLVDGDVDVLLEPGQAHNLVIIDRRNQLEVPKDAPPQRIYMFIHWRKTSSSWLWQFPVPVVTSTYDIQRIAAAATERATFHTTPRQS
jgi:hypothetical protein